MLIINSNEKLLSTLHWPSTWPVHRAGPETYPTPPCSCLCDTYRTPPCSCLWWRRSGRPSPVGRGPGSVSGRRSRSAGPRGRHQWSWHAGWTWKGTGRQDSGQHWRKTSISYQLLGLSEAILLFRYNLIAQIVGLLKGIYATPVKWIFENS